MAKKTLRMTAKWCRYFSHTKLRSGATTRLSRVARVASSSQYAEILSRIESSIVNESPKDSAQKKRPHTMDAWFADPARPSPGVVHAEDLGRVVRSAALAGLEPIAHYLSDLTEADLTGTRQAANGRRKCVIVGCDASDSRGASGAQRIADLSSAAAAPAIMFVLLPGADTRKLRFLRAATAVEGCGGGRGSGGGSGTPHPPPPPQAQRGDDMILAARAGGASLARLSRLASRDADAPARVLDALPLISPAVHVDIRQAAMALEALSRADVGAARAAETERADAEEMQGVVEALVGVALLSLGDAARGLPEGGAEDVPLVSWTKSMRADAARTRAARMRGQKEDGREPKPKPPPKKKIRSRSSKTTAACP